MKDEKKTKAQLIQELEDLRLQVAEQEKSETERKRAEEGLRLNEALYRELINSNRQWKAET